MFALRCKACETQNLHCTFAVALLLTLYGSEGDPIVPKALTGLMQRCEHDVLDHRHLRKGARDLKRSCETGPKDPIWRQPVYPASVECDLPTIRGRSVLTSRAGGETVATGELPQWIVDLPRNTVFTIGRYEVRTMFVLALVIAIVAHLVLQYTRGGRHLYAVGSNPEAARQAGVATRRVQIAAFVACGALAGFAGFLFVGRFGTINVTAGSGLELAAIAAAVVGGVSTLGGSGTVMGAFVGAVLIAVLDQSLVRVEQISEFWRDAILGALILLAVLLDVTVSRRLRERARRHTLAVRGADA